MPIRLRLPIVVGCSDCTGILLIVLLAASCTDVSAARKLAFIDAGAEVRRGQSGQTYEEVRKDLELAIDRDVARVREKARRELDRLVLFDRRGFAAGLGIASLGISSGTLQGTAGTVFTILGVGIASGAIAQYLSRGGDLKECVAWLDRSEARLGPSIADASPARAGFHTRSGRNTST